MENLIHTGRAEEKTKKSDLGDLQKVRSLMARALFEQDMIILLAFTKPNTCNRILFGKYGWWQAY